MYCPNKNSEEYKEMKRVLGDEITHFIWDSNNGNPIHVAPNGKDSKLFSDLLKVSDSREDAIKAKAKIYTEKFKSVFDGKNVDDNGEPLVKEVLNDSELSERDVNYSLKAVNILQSNKASELFNKGIKNDWTLDKVLNEIGGFGKKTGYKDLFNKEELNNRVSGGQLEGLIVDLVSNYSYTVEVKTAKDKDSVDKGMELVDDSKAEQPSRYYYNLTVPGGTNYTENEISTPLITPSIKGHADFSTDKGIGWFRSDNQVIGGKEQLMKPLYDEQGDWIPRGDPDLPEIETVGGRATKTRRILELQSDLFQKGRKNTILTKEFKKKTIKGGILKGYGMSIINYDKDDIIQKTFDTKEEAIEFKNTLNTDEWDVSTFDIIENRTRDKIVEDPDFPSNQFLQLLNKDNNWVNFFVKSIVQDSVKKGYEKVLFPSGETAAKVEGHETIASEIKNITSEINRLANEQIRMTEGDENYNNIEKELESLRNKRKKLKSEGLEKLKPIEGFYEKRVKNILTKTYGKESIKEITDEHGNTWNELTLDKERDLDNILLSATDKAISDNITNEVDFENSNDLEQFAESNDFKEPVREGRGDNSYDFVFEKGKELGMTINPEEVTVNKVQENPGQHPLTAIAYYNRFSNKVTLTDRFKHLTKNDQKRILAHETLHGIITDKVNKMSDSKLAEFEGKLQGFIDSVKANENLMRTDSVKRVLKAVEEGGLQELITYGFTDKEFAAMLNGEVLRRPGEEEEEEVRTFWTRLKELIVSVLSDDYTKLDELTDIMDAYLDIDKSSEISRPSNPKVTQEEIDRRNRFTPSDLYAAYSKENDTETKPTEEEITEDDEAKLDNAVNTIKRGLRSRINAIKKNMRESSPDRDILKERADFLERQLKELEESTNIETFIEASEEMIKWIEDDLIGSETLYSSNIMQAKDNWSIMMKVTEDLLKIKNLDNVTGEKDNTVNNRVAQKKLKDLRSKLSDIVRDIYASENKFLIQKSTRTMNEALTEQDLMEALPENFIKANTMELAVYKDKLLQLASALMQNADKNRMAEYRQEYGSPLEAILEKLGRNQLTKEDKEFLKQKDKNDEWTGSLVSRFSNEWDLFMDDYISSLSRIHHRINLAKDNPTKLKKAQEDLKKEINKRKKISAYVDPHNLSDEASKNKEVERLSEFVGRDLAEEMVNSAEEKLNEYRLDEAAKRDEMESLSDEKAKEEFEKWERHRNPFRAYNELMSESMDYTQAFAYLEGAPKKYNESGRRTKWHDSDYDAIQNSELKDLYNFIVESTDKLSKNLPEHVRHKIRHNFVAFIEKSTMTKMKERGLSSDVIVDEYYKTISDSTAEDSSPVYDADNKLIKSVPITLAEDRMMFLEKKQKKYRNKYNRALNSIENYNTLEETTEAQDKANEDNKEFVRNYSNLIEEIRKEKDKYRSNKSDNFLNAFQLFAMMSVNYKHKMDILDSVRIARDVYERAVVPEKTPLGKWSTYMGKKVTTKSNKEQTMDALDYAIDSIMFGEKKKKELMGKVKVGVSKEGREAKKRHMEALSELRKRRNRGEMSYEEYEDEKTKLDDLLAENMDINYLSFTRMIDSITKYVYYRHIGWNPRSSIANWFYGEMANNIEASSGQFYNSGNLKVARHQMRSALKKALGMGQDEESKKINNLMLNFGIMYDMLDISYGDGKALTEKAKKFGVLNPFELFKRGEFRNQGLILLAMLDNTKITDRKGNRRKLYDAFDVDGKFNVKEFDNSDGEWDIISDGNQFTKKRNQINGLIRRLHGNYDPSHPLKAKGQSIGRMLMVFKTWMPQGVYSRFGEEMYLDELGASVKGRWRTLYDIGFKDSLTLFKDVAAAKWLGGAKLGEDYTKFKDIDIQNMRRNVQELVWLAGMAVATLIGYALLPDDDDDEESSEARKYMANVILDMTARLSGDITMYVSPSTPEQALSIPLMRDIGYTADAIFSVFEEMSEEEYDYKKIAKKIGQQLPGTTQIISVMDI